jgi:hypothetical protein
LEIPSGETAVLTFDLQIYRPGHFRACRTLFLDDGALREVPISAEGMAVAANDVTRSNED